MHPISTPDAPPPAGHYAQAIVHGGLVFVAGQLPVDPKTGVVVADSAAAQTELTLRNVEAILHAAGSSLDQVLSATVYVTSREYWGEVNAVFAKLFRDHKPARAIVPVAALKAGCFVEIQVVAATAADTTL